MGRWDEPATKNEWTIGLIVFVAIASAAIWFVL